MTTWASPAPSSARPRRDGAPGLLGAAGRNREAALRSLRRLHPRAGAAVGGHAGPVQHADQGQRLRESKPWPMLDR